jgi:hypothetical protein
VTKKRSRKPRYKSKWEVEVAEQLEKQGIPLHYEEDVIQYTIPESNNKYHPDFRISKDVFLEAKGKWVAQDRKKHLLLKEQHPDIKIYIIFQNANQKIRKGSKTSYGDWATKHGIEWSHKVIKKEWLI